MRLSRVLLLLLPALLLSGCSFWGGSSEEDCRLVREYQKAQAAPEVATPAGLDALDPERRLHVPEEPLPAEPLSDIAGCLQKPPPYFDKPLEAEGS